MGTSSNAHIGYGIILDEGVELPWEEEGLDKWYCRASHGKDFGGKYREMWDFLRQNPIPFQLENYCSGEYPIYALVVTGTIKTATRGRPTNFNPSDLVVTPEAVEKFLAAIGLSGIECDKASIGWILYSYLG